MGRLQNKYAAIVGLITVSILVKVCLKHGIVFLAPIKFQLASFEVSMVSDMIMHILYCR